MIKCFYCHGKKLKPWVYKSHNKYIPNKLAMTKCDLCLGTGKLDKNNIFELGILIVFFIFSILSFIFGGINKNKIDLICGINMIFIDLCLCYVLFNRMKIITKK